MQLKRCYLSFFNATRDIIANIKYSKTRGAGDISPCFSEFSINTSTGFAEGVVEFDEQVWSDKLTDGLTQQGAASITILTFQNNDKNKSAGAALARVWKSAEGRGFELVTTGECDAKMLSKAKEIVRNDEKGKTTVSTFDEKTQEAVKQSMALQHEMNEKMLTKEDFMKMKDNMTVEFSQTITNQAQTIKELENAVATKDRDNQLLSDHNYSQRCVLARLNNEKTVDSNTIRKLNEKIESKDKIIIELMEKNQALSNNSKSIVEEKILEMHTIMQEYIVCDESRKRKSV